MKNVYLLLSSMFLSGIAMQSQWNIDPANPALVCDATCNQLNVTSLSDGSGGAFVFWRDSRSGCDGNTYYDIYGQHYSNTGDKLWQETGRLIYDLHSSIASYAVRKGANPGEIIVGAHTGFNSALDSLRFQKINYEGEKLWSNDLLVAYAQGCIGNYFLGFENFSFTPIGDGYKVNLVPVYCGGANGCRITQFSDNGVLTGPLHGEPESNQYYIGGRGIANTFDGSDDIYLYHTNGNGTGAHATVMRVSAAGDSAFAPIDVLDGTNGLNYQFAALSDPSGITVCFVSNGEFGGQNIYLRKLNSDGSWAWNGDVMPVCEAEGTQSTFHWIQDDDYFYIVWADGRPGVIGYYAIYAQKIAKATGQVMWEENGKLLADINTYAPEPRFAFDDNDNLMLVFQATVEPLFNARLFDQDGIPIWDNAISIAGYALGPFYSDYAVIRSDDNMIIAWAKSFSGGGADGIYIARLAQPSTTIEETISACNSYTANGETFTESGVYTQELPGDTTYVLNLTINSANIDLLFDGNTMEAQTTEGFIYWLDCTDNTIVLDDSQTFTPDETGNYALIVNNNACVDTSDCYLIEVISVNEIPVENFYSIYPNPGNDQLTLQSYSGFTNASIQIADATGRIVSLHNAVNGVLFTTNTKDLQSGVYILQITNRESRNTIVWIKN